MKTAMTRQILALLLAISLCVSLAPGPAFAASSIGGTAPAAQENSGVLGLQMMEELMQMTIEEGQPLTEDYYAADVLAEINGTYAEAIEYVKAHPGEIEAVSIFIMVSEEVQKRLLKLESLMPLTREVYQGSSDIGSLKKLLRTNYNTITSGVKRADYNNWYWDKYVVQRAAAKKAIDGIHDLKGYLDASQQDLFLSFAEALSTDDEEMWIDMDEGEGASLSGFLMENSIEPYSIVNKDLVAGAIEAGQEELSGLIEAEKDVPWKPFRPSKALQQMVKDFTKNAQQLQDLNMIVKLFDKINKKFDAEYDPYIQARLALDPAGELTDSDITRWLNKMEQKYYAYNRSLYSVHGAELLTEVFYDYSGKMESCYTQKEASALWTKYLTAMNRVPVLTKELKDTRAKYLQAWNKKYKKKAYNQKKVKKLLANGKKAMNQAKTMEALEAVHASYTAKLNAAIKTFRVKVTKKGKGTVSKTAKVKYGKTYVLKIKPAPGHALESVTINGKQKKKLKYTYKLKIKKKTNIKVVFR